MNAPRFLLVLSALLSVLLPTSKSLRTGSITVAMYFLFKWLMDYRKCTVSYIECKLRGVPKERGYLYRFLEAIFSVNEEPLRTRAAWYALAVTVTAYHAFAA